jgi:DNA-binding NarL/FixJ family response regulator
MMALDRPDMAIVDIRMPPTATRTGGGAAHPRALPQDLGRPAQPVPGAPLRPAAARRPAGGLGYLLKERVSDIAVLVDALRWVTEGECVLDTSIVARRMQRERPDSPLTYLSRRST